MSWPEGASVNDGIQPDKYLESNISLRYPTVDNLCKRAKKLGKGCKGYKKYMARAFRQIPIDPMDWSLLGIYWQGALFLVKATVMGCRTAPYICQHITNVIRHIMANVNYYTQNYVDNFMGIECDQQVWAAYNTLGNLLRNLRVKEAEDKVVLPTSILEFLGTGFDLDTFLLFTTPQKLAKIMQELETWIHKTTMTHNQLESIVGKLQAVSNCIRLMRIFISRAFNKIPLMKRGRMYQVDEMTRKDLKWWRTFLPQYNGTSIMWLEQLLTPDAVLATDVCLTGIGGMCKDQYFHEQLPHDITEREDLHIAHFKL